MTHFNLEVRDGEHVLICTPTEGAPARYRLTASNAESLRSVAEGACALLNPPPPEEPQPEGAPA